MKNLIYADAAAPGAGYDGIVAGIGIVIITQEGKKSFSKPIDVGPTHIIEGKALLLALIKALILYPRLMNEEIHLYSDSTNVVDMISGVAKNRFTEEFWQTYLSISEMCSDLHIHHIRRHSLGGIKEMDEADFLAKLAANNDKMLFSGSVRATKYSRPRQSCNVRLIDTDGLIVQTSIQTTGIRDALSQVSGIINKNIREVEVRL